MTPLFDVAVLGPGPAGSACAIELARAGQRVALLGPLADEAQRGGEIIGPQARHRLPMADHLPGIPVRFVASAWSSDETSIYDLKLSTGRCGVTAARPSFDCRLLAEARDAGAFHDAARVRACSRDGAIWRIHRAGRAAPLAARFVVEATGRAGRSSALVGAKRHFLDRLIVMWCLVVSDGIDEDTLHLATTADGWWYRVPNGRGRAFLALATDADLVPATARARFFERCAGGTVFAADARRRATPLGVVDARTSLRLPQSAPGWMPIGDAAFSLDPLSGDGVSRALADGVAIARSLVCKQSSFDAATELNDLAVERLRSTINILSNRSTHYAAALEWPNSLFWLRRNQSSTIF